MRINNMDSLCRVFIIRLQVSTQRLKSLATALIVMACSMLITMQVVSEEQVHVSLDEHILVNGQPKSFQKIKRFSSLSLAARIVPSISNDSFEFFVNFSSVPTAPRANPASSFRMELMGESCSEPLDFSLRKVDEDYQYSYHTFYDSFSALSDIDIDLKYSGVNDGEHIYLAQVNGQEAMVSTENRIKHITLYVSGANLEIEKVVINKGN